MADMRSCYEASVATRGAETQIFFNENGKIAHFSIGVSPP